MMQMDAPTIWVTTVMLALIIFALRNAFLFVPASLRPRGLLERALRYAPLAALAALVSPEILRGWLEATTVSAALLADPRLLSALALMIAVRLTGNALIGLLTGCGVFLAL
jgi:branched-subunit amino acid transport protein